MAYQHHSYHHTSPTRGSNSSIDTPKPRLPNFEHFVRGAGQYALAQTIPRREPMLEGLTPEGHPSLPTPPLTHTSRYFYDGQEQRPIWPDEGAPVTSDRASITADLHRRASFALPIQARPQARSVRAYSSTNPERSHPAFPSTRYDQVIQEEDYSNERSEYVYEDAVIGTRELTPADVGCSPWGITKAGKPRKRLSQACVTCREKKIKCDPGGGAKCSQCFRFNRECKFDTNSRQGHKSSKFRSSAHAPDAKSVPVHSPHERLSSHSPMLLADAPLSSDVVHRASSLSSTSVDEVISPTMSDRQPNDAPTPSKRQRTSVDSSSRLATSEHNGAWQHNIDAQSYQFGYSAEIDPTIGNERLTKHYLEMFMDCFNIPTFEIFPKKLILKWAYTEPRKSLHDRVVLYAMLALGTIHSTESQRASHRAHFRSIVYAHLDHIEAEYSLQSAHVLLFLKFLEYSEGQMQKAFNMFVRTVGCVFSLGLNVEYTGHETAYSYGLSPAVYAECRRRTFWAVYSTDIHSALSVGDPRIMQSTDIFLRLPCSSELYEEGTIPRIAVFDQENVLKGIPTSEELIKMSDMVHVIQIASICSDVQLNAWRRSNLVRLNQQPPPDRAGRQRLERRLELWADTYNAALRAEHQGSNNTDLFTSDKDSSARAKRYAGLDILYHYAHMELNRRTYHRSFDDEELLRHARNANIHALEILKFTQQLLKHGGSSTRDYYLATRGPVGGGAIHTAIDIITAAGSIADILAPQSSIMTLLWGGCELLEQISGWWGLARTQHLQAKERIQTVFNLCQAAVYDSKSYFYCTEPMDSSRERDFDTIYGMSRRQYLAGAYGLSKVREGDIFVIETGKGGQKLVVS